MDDSDREIALLTEERQSREKLSRLLELTRPASTWQPHLVQLLGQQILEDGARQTVAFLQHVLTMGRETMQALERRGVDSRRGCGYLVPVDKRLAPLVIDVDRCKKILISLGFEIEQPDGYHSIDNVDVLVGAGLMSSALDGMYHLLALVNYLPWSILRMILTLSHKDAFALCSLTEANSNSPHLQDQASAKDLLSRYPEEMAHLGFKKEHRIVIKTTSHFEQNRLNKIISLILKAMFEEGPPDIATFV